MQTLTLEVRCSDRSHTVMQVNASASGVTVEICRAKLTAQGWHLSVDEGPDYCPSCALQHEQAARVGGDGSDE